MYSSSIYSPSVSTGAQSMLPGQDNPLFANDAYASGNVSSTGEKGPAPKPDRNSNVRLMLMQSPKHAKVAVGKEKGRKPIDPPPVLKLVDERPDESKPLHPSPFYFAVCDLVTEDEKELPKSAQPLTNVLVGTRTSSIHHSSDSNPRDEGYFVFGDLGVKLEGRYRLRFNLYDRDDNVTSPSFYHVTQLVSNVFTVFSHRQFPGMAESTPLTQRLVEQGVKLRRRKDSQALTTTKRNRKTADDCRRRQLKRRETARTPSLEGSMSGSSHTRSPTNAIANFISAPGIGAMAGSSNSQTLGSGLHSNNYVDYSSTSYMGPISGPTSQSVPPASDSFMDFRGTPGMGMVSGMATTQPISPIPNDYMDFRGTAYMGAASGTSNSQSLPPASDGFMDFNSGPYMESPLTTANSAPGSTNLPPSFLSSPVAGQFPQSYPPDLPGESINTPSWYNQGHPYGFSKM